MGGRMRCVIDPVWLKPFKGADLSFVDCELIAAEKIGPEQMEMLWAGMDSIWFDYCRLHPVKSLYYFVQCYSESFGLYLDTNIDHGMRFHRGVKGDPLESRELRQMIGLKLQADRLGIPYPEFIRAAFAHFASIGWTRPPRPSHILASDEAINRALESWVYKATAFVQFAADPWFDSTEWRGEAQQQRYEEFLVASLRERQHKRFGVAHAVYGLGQLRIERALTEFGPDVVRDAISHHEIVASFSVDAQ